MMNFKVSSYLVPLLYKSSGKTFNAIRHASAATGPTVGFIGIGNMGSAMVSNLLKNGHQVVVYDVSSSAINSAVAQGAKAASSVAELSSQSDRVITMLPTPDIVKATFRGANGIMANSKKGSILIDSSTVGPETPKELAPEAEALGLTFIDAPVTGAVPAARAGTLTFLVGGTEQQYQQVKQLLSGMGKNIVHCGETGSGQAAKICNNMCLAINMISTAETLNLAVRLGLDAKLMNDILNISSGRSWCTEIYCPAPGVMQNVPANEDYNFGFQVELISKDLSLAQHSATQVKQPLPLGSQAYQTYLTMLNRGWPKKDFSSVFKYLQDESKKN